MKVSREIEHWWLLQRLMTRYAIACDEGNWTLYRSVFLPGAYIDYSEASGRAGRVEEILPWLERVMDRSRVLSTQHMLANLEVQVADERAIGRTHYFNPDVIAEGGASRALLNGGLYRFTATLTDTGWKLNSLKATLLWSTRAELATLPPSE
jgi:hypothetical protein